MKYIMILLLMSTLVGCSTSQQISRESDAINGGAKEIVRKKQELDATMGTTSPQPNPSYKGTASKKFEQYTR